jgi:hypothetical protein
MSRILLQCLAEANAHAVPEYRKDAVDKRLYFSVEFHVLLVQEFDDRLRHRHSDFFSHSSSSWYDPLLLYSFVSQQIRRSITLTEPFLC